MSRETDLINIGRINVYHPNTDVYSSAIRTDGLVCRIERTTKLYKVVFVISKKNKLGLMIYQDHVLLTK